jgi:predicted O-methyltransferase YrrM
MTTPEYLAKTLIALAEQVPEGSCIVELGTYHGKGTIALAKGAPEGVEVIAVDDYTEKKGWIGEPYGPEDAQVFYENIKNAGVHVTLSRMNFDDAATMWNRSIGLLYWDPGIPKRFMNDFVNWSPFIIPGGVFIAKDTAQGHLGTFNYIDRIVRGKGWEKFNYWNGVSFLRRLDGHD